jgi:hypothetical protein
MVPRRLESAGGVVLSIAAIVFVLFTGLQFFWSIFSKQP